MSEKKAAETSSPEEIRKEIEGTREELGDTVAAVAEKTDVKKQAKAKVDDVKAQVSEKAGEAKLKAEEVVEQNPAPLAIVAAVVGLLVLWRLLRR